MQLTQVTAWQDRLTSQLARMLDEGRGLRDTLRLALVAVGRGGQGDVGQRIRDEILHVQAQNNARVHAADFLHRLFGKFKQHLVMAYCASSYSSRVSAQCRLCAGKSIFSCKSVSDDDA